MRVIKAPAIAFRLDGIRPAPFIEGLPAQLIAATLQPSLHIKPIVTVSRSSWYVDLRVWFATADGKRWSSPSIARMSLPEYAATRARTVWERRVRKSIVLAWAQWTSYRARRRDFPRATVE